MFSAAAAVRRTPLLPPSGPPFVYEISVGAGHPFPSLITAAGPSGGPIVDPYYTADWGDGSPIELIDYPSATHTYVNAGVYIVTFVGTIPYQSYGSSNEEQHINKVLNFGGINRYSITGFLTGALNFTSFTAGTTQIGDLKYIFAAFQNTRNLATVDFDGWVADPNVAVVCNGLFTGNDALTSVIDFANWKVEDITHMLSHCPLLPPQPSISTWDVSELQLADYFMFNSPTAINQTIYDQTLTNWGAQTVLSGTVIDFGLSAVHTAAGQAGRDSLIAQGWTIYDASNPRP